ncbi:hypothetical protein, partial [Streptococcus pneumoniae]|uniref:hypothetical protein n=1 Tax=Streptococcus pneumoniae TaxID=1313 RepID=UPI001E4A8054
IYQWGGGYTFVTPPRYDFKTSETGSDGIVVNSASPDSGWTRILVATRSNGLVESYGSPAMIEVNLSGFNTVTACIV